MLPVWLEAKQWKSGKEMASGAVLVYEEEEESEGLS